MKPVIIPGFIGPTDLLAESDFHRLSIGDSQRFHAPSAYLIHYRKASPLCCIAYDAVYNSEVGIIFWRPIVSVQMCHIRLGTENRFSQKRLWTEPEVTPYHSELNETLRQDCGLKHDYSFHGNLHPRGDYSPAHIPFDAVFVVALSGESPKC
jgi:hypothetical protein